jgi:hypothetical protein
MGNGSDVWEMLVENVPSTLCGDRRARAGGPDKIRTCGLCLRRAAAWPDRCLREIGNREERTGIRFEKERVYGYSAARRRSPLEPLAPAIAPIRGSRRWGPGLARPQSKTRRVHPMSIKLTDTQLVLLGAAAQRKDLCLVAPPTLKGATGRKSRVS